MSGAVLARAGHWLHAHQKSIRAVQWAVIASYIVLVTVPAFLPMPDGARHIWNNLTLFAQFAFWGVWWPFVILSMVVVGRAWCGLFCPEGALSEFASERGRGRAVPRWITWAGWPFVAFACTTVYGQMISVYDYPKPTLLILGGSTCAAVAVGFLYGRRKRVWCRYLCPVNGVFAVLSKLAPVHFRVDRRAWGDSQAGRGVPPRPFTCAPLVPVRTMEGASDCHMCARCDSFRGAVALQARATSHEIVHVAGKKAAPWETVLVLYGLMGIAPGAFQWSASPWYVAAKMALAEWLVDIGALWSMQAVVPWWIFTSYAERNDVMTPLDGAVLLAYIGVTAVILGTGIGALLALASRALGRWAWARFHHLAQALIPLAGCGVFLGLSALTVTMLRHEGLDLEWVDVARIGLLAGASLWSLRLAWSIAGRTAGGAKRLHAMAWVSLAALLADGGWALLFWGWS